MSSPDSAIKRPARTYGRARRQVQPPSPVPPPVSPTDDDDDSSFSAADASRDSINVPLLSSPAAREPPPSSSDNDLSFNLQDDDDGDTPDTSPDKGGFKSFGWKETLDAMDKEDGGDASPRKFNPLVSTIYGKSHVRSAKVSAMEEDAHSSSDADLSEEENIVAVPKSSQTVHGGSMDMSHSAVDARGDDEDPFDGPLPALTQSSLSENGMSSGSSPPRPTLPRTRRRVVLQSDSSDEDNSDAQQPRPPRDAMRRAKTIPNSSARTRSSASPETSPGQLHHINTPNTSFGNDFHDDAFATPPTSQEMPPTAKDKVVRRGGGKNNEDKEVSQASGSKQVAVESENDQAQEREDPLETAVFADGKMKSRKERRAIADKKKGKVQRVKVRPICRTGCFADTRYIPLLYTSSACPFILPSLCVAMANVTCLLHPRTRSWRICGLGAIRAGTDKERAG